MGLTAFDNLILSLHMTPLGITPKEDYIFFMNTTTKTKVKRRSNGEGSITKLKNGRYMGKIMLGRKADGKPNRKTVYGETQTEVLKKINELIYEYNHGIYVEPNRMMFGEWLKIWLTTFKKKKLKSRTYDTYETQINTHITPTLGTLALKDITPFHIQEFYNNLFDNNLAAATVRKIHQIIKPALAKAEEQGLIRNNPAAKGIELPPLVQKPVTAFSVGEQAIFFDTAKNYTYYDAFLFAVNTGLRSGELLALQWDDIDFINGYVNVNKTLTLIKDRDKQSKNSYILKIKDGTKTKAGVRKIPLTKRCIRMLKQLKLKNIAKTQLVFPSRNGTYINPRNFLRCFKTICEKAELEGYNCHTLRHTFATRCFERGIPVKIVSRWLGHKKVQHTLDIYTHVMPDEEKKAIEKLENDTESLEVAPPEYIKITQ